jgi:hypothetical protein
MKRQPFWFEVTRASLVYLLVRCVWDTKKFARSAHRGEDFLWMIYETGWFAAGQWAFTWWRRRRAR